MTRRLTVFAKPPLPGVAKSRLAADIGDEKAASIAEAMLKDTIVLCERAIGFFPRDEAELILAYTDDRDWFGELLTEDWKLLGQRGGDLGERLENALEDLGVSEDDGTVFVGMDSPHQPVQFVRDAFAMLNSSDTVLGPCEDGGYYLVGVRGAWPEGIFEDVRWSTRHAFADTKKAFEAAGLSCAILPKWYDIDNIEQLQRLVEELARAPDAVLPNTRQVLAEIDTEADRR